MNQWQPPAHRIASSQIMQHAPPTLSVPWLPPITRQRFALVLLASATALLTVAPSFWDALWPLAWGALMPLLLALREVSPGRALLLGWWAETLMYWLGFYWLIGTMVRFGALAVPVSVLLFAMIGSAGKARAGQHRGGLSQVALPLCPAAAPRDTHHIIGPRTSRHIRGILQPCHTYRT